jgi:hypothetical protein
VENIFLSSCTFWYVTSQCEGRLFAECPPISYFNWTYFTHYTETVRASQPTNRVWIPGRGSGFFSSAKCPDRLWDLPSRLSIRRWGCFIAGGEAAGAWICPLLFGAEFERGGGIPAFLHLHLWRVQDGDSFASLLFNVCSNTFLWALNQSVHRIMIGDLFKLREKCKSVLIWQSISWPCNNEIYCSIKLHDEAAMMMMMIIFALSWLLTCNLIFLYALLFYNCTALKRVLHWIASWYIKEIVATAHFLLIWCFS